MDPELLKLGELRFWIQTGLGFALLAAVVVMSWRRRNGNGAGQAKAPDLPGAAVLFSQLNTLAQDVHQLSKDIGLYSSAHETAARNRHDVVMACLDDWRDENVRALEGIRKDRGAA